MCETLVAGELAGYSPEVGAALWRLEDARSRTLRLLSEIPAEYVDAKDNAKDDVAAEGLETTGNSIGTILYHIALIEADWLSAEILEEPYSDEIKQWLPVDDRDQAGILTLVQGQTLEQHLARLSAIRTILLDKLRGMTTEEFQRQRNLPSYDVSPAWVLHHLAQHEAEHRGEMGSVIARLKAST